MRVVRMFLWESVVLGVVGAVASVVVGAMAAGVLICANIALPLSVRLFLMSDTFELPDLLGALGGAIGLISLVTGAHALASRASPRLTS
jgi:ABC-type lipoprotein release transport system permease subunit